MLSKITKHFVTFQSTLIKTKVLANYGRYPLAAAHWPLPTGRYPLAAAHWPLALEPLDVMRLTLSRRKFLKKIPDIKIEILIWHIIWLLELRISR